ncbi:MULTISPECIES: ABC transporter ATP-binding protein [Gibbsiella]|uniref:Spermidine/putrescine import ATP-binding protein PotA n=1 Tax=Gibbsiella dentisursi TaxID=796890 RepID=A0ABP7KQR0_9GAMM|nr:ABC transporter ATP-binding protein [Gibbsiella quercinecans]
MQHSDNTLAPRTPARTLMSLNNLNKHYGDFAAVDNISLNIRDGEFLTFLGSSGSGKSTTLSMLAGFEEPTSGQILLDGKSMLHVPPHKRDIGMVFQRYSLFPHMNVSNNVAFPLTMRKIDASERTRRVKEMLELVQLENFAHRFPAQLSGGQQQRVAIARALVYKPRILLMDEPLGALDKKLREDIQQKLREIHRELGISIIYVTHDQEEALRLSQRIAIFNHGKIVGLGTGYDLYQAPPDAFVASFLGNSNFLQVTVQDRQHALLANKRLCIKPGGDLSPNQQVLLMLRPEKLQPLSLAQAQTTPLANGCNEIDGVLIDKVFLGDNLNLQVSLPDGTQVTTKTRPELGGVFSPGDRLALRWHQDDACLYSQWNDSDLAQSKGKA